MESLTRSRMYSRRSVRGTAAVLAVGAAVGSSFLLGTGAANAAPGGEGANVIKEFLCFEGGNPGAPALATTQTQAVITPSGNTKLTCHFEGPAVEETVTLKDVPCSTFLGPATNSHFVYTKSGHATLTCEVKH